MNGLDAAYPNLTSLTDAEIESARDQALTILKAHSWPVLWAVAAGLGFVDSLGGAEYRQATAERLNNGQYRLLFPQ
jgi:hypothetical protein